MATVAAHRVATSFPARTRYDLSVLYRERGKADAAEATLAEACQIFHDHGAREYSEIKK